MVEVQKSFEMTQKTCKNLTDASIRMRDENVSLKADFVTYIRAAQDQCRVFADVIPMFSAERSVTFYRLQNTMEQIKQKYVNRKIIGMASVRKDSRSSASHDMECLLD